MLTPIKKTLSWLISTFEYQTNCHISCVKTNEDSSITFILSNNVSEISDKLLSEFEKKHNILLLKKEGANKKGIIAFNLFIVNDEVVKFMDNDKFFFQHLVNMK